MLPKKTLDSELIEMLIKYYKFNLTDEEKKAVEEWECFSHPSLEQHACNQRVLMPGGHKCETCANILGRPCDISCDIQTFCLAVFAWRNGIGGEDLYKALKHNLHTLKPNDLYDAVTMKLSCGDAADAFLPKPKKAKETAPPPPESPPARVIDEDAKSSTKKTKKVKKKDKTPVKKVLLPVEEKVEEKVEAPKVEHVREDGEVYYSLREVAKIRKCTYSNIYIHATRGRLPFVEFDGKKFVKKSVLDKFKTKKRSK